MKNLNKVYRKLFICLIFIVISFISCKNYLDIDPPKESATPVEMFSNDEIATSAITGIYTRMANSTPFSGDRTSISVLAGLTSDELRSHTPLLNTYFVNEIPPTEAALGNLWKNVYAYIYTTNAVLEGLESNSKVSEKIKSQLQGEAKFIRAFCYFYLINLFGDVPLNLTTDYRINAVAAKSTKQKIYNQIISDLVDAEILLGDSYITNERVRPNKWAAKALLSRIYLFTERWALAEQKATEVIENKLTYRLMDDLERVFLKNSNEAIWQLMPNAGTNTKEGTLFILNTTPTDVSLSPAILPLFESNDNRKNKWIGEFSNASGKYYYPFKYKIKNTVNGSISEYSMIIRLAEIYLIRAEARAKQEKLMFASDDINVIRKRAGLINPLVGLSSVQYLVEIEKQRVLELFSELGHRWFDLKRQGKAGAILKTLKGSSWQDTDILYPIPDAEVNTNINITQNVGY